MGHGAYDPVRPVATLARAIGNARDERAGYSAQAGKSLAIAFSGSGVESVDVIDRLSAMLDANGMGYTRMGGILVRDGSTRWGAIPICPSRESRCGATATTPPSASRSKRACAISWKTTWS